MYFTNPSNLQADSKSEIDIQAAVKMPPLPGQSRSLLQFDGTNNDIADMKDFHETVEVETSVPAVDKTVMIKIEEDMESDPPYSDHDYTYNYKFEDKGVKVEAGTAKAWIDEDEPPMVSVCHHVETG